MKNKSSNTLTYFFLSFSCLIAFMIGSMTIANADKSDVATLGLQKEPDVELMLGKAEMVNISGEISDVLVADPSIVDVMAIKSNRLYLVGSALGDTNIMVLDDQGNVLKKFNIHVQLDTEKIQALVREIYPDEIVEIRSVTDQVIVSGEVSTPAVANKITHMIGHYVGEAQGLSEHENDRIIVNLLGIRGEQQVMLRVKIVEASRSALKDLGLNLQSLGGASLGDANGSFNSTPGLGLSAPQQFGAALLNYSSGTFGNLSFLAQALEQEGIINTLAEPNLTAISGEQAGFLAGGEFPIPTQIDRNGNLIYEFRPFGVSLNFRPIVMSEDRISLQLTTEVSTTSFDQNLQLNGINVPTFNVRRAETNVELPSGGTLMIAGLIKSDSISGLTQLPGVSDIPVVGDLIKSDSFRRSESEVVVMITPYLVQPFAKNNTQPHAVTGNSMVNRGTIGSYGSIEPPMEPEREINRMQSVFANNMRRIYGDDAPEDLLSSNHLGYMMD